MLDVRTSAEVENSIRRVDVILKSGIFDRKNCAHPLYFSALTEFLICLNDLLGKAASAGHDINFSDEVTKKGTVTDVRSLVTFVRNAVCHVSSPNHDHDEVDARLSYVSCIGKGCAAEIDGVRIENIYDDDTAFFFGPQRLYLNRHAIRAFEAARAALTPLLWTDRGA